MFSRSNSLEEWHYQFYTNKWSLSGFQSIRIIKSVKRQNLHPVQANQIPMSVFWLIHHTPSSQPLCLLQNLKGIAIASLFHLFHPFYSPKVYPKLTSLRNYCWWFQLTSNFPFSELMYNIFQVFPENAGFPKLHRIRLCIEINYKSCKLSLF